MTEIDPAVLAAIQNRLDGIRDWIVDDAPYIMADQHNLDANTPEQECWRYVGYQAALAMSLF
jgi:hypothetical protein